LYLNLFLDQIILSDDYFGRRLVTMVRDRDASLFNDVDPDMPDVSKLKEKLRNLIKATPNLT